LTNHPSSSVNLPPLKRTRAFLQLMRPANIVTAISDVLAGIAISGYFLPGGEQASWRPVFLLGLSTVGLYGGGIVFNDYFDADIDRVERPERPIPSGLVSKMEAAVLALALLFAGVLSAFLWSTVSGGIAVLIAFASVIYDKWGKHAAVAGPINMGICRGLNLLLGISIVPDALIAWWVIAGIPVLYVAALTMISRGEVHGGNPVSLKAALFMYAAVILSIALTGLKGNGNAAFIIIFLSLFALMIYRPLLKAIRIPEGKNIGKAVRAGVLGLILMNAAWAASQNAIGLAFVILLLLPLSLVLARLFAVS
jgi:4-hydroxybenzoate polyprenyltransferase